MSYRKRIYIEEIPRVSIGKDYRAIETLLMNKGGIKMTINEAKRKSAFFFRYYKDFPISENGVVICSIPCNYGGIRYFYLCPYCRKRYKHLYITRGKKHPRLACRKCCYLFYRTQSETQYDRLISGLSKLLHNYRLNTVFINKTNKPKGMTKKRFYKIKSKIENIYWKISIYPIFQE